MFLPARHQLPTCHPHPPVQGDVVAISPYASHLDPRFYQQAPGAYNPNRQGAGKVVVGAVRNRPTC